MGEGGVDVPEGGVIRRGRGRPSSEKDASVWREGRVLLRGRTCPSWQKDASVSPEGCEHRVSKVSRCDGESAWGGK